MSQPGNPIHPMLRALALEAAAQPSMADLTPQQAPAGIAAPAAARGPGRSFEEVPATAIPGRGGDIAARIYIPLGAQGTVVAFHGGGWLRGSRDTFDSVCRNLAADSGLAVVNVDYRLAPEHPFPAAVEDAWAALCWVSARGAELRLPTQRLVVMGESAGGNLA